MSTRMHAVIAGTVLAVAATFPPGPADARDFTLWAGSTLQQFFSGEVDPVMEDRFSAGAGLRFGVEAYTNLLVEAEWVRSTSKSELFQAFDTTFVADQVLVGLRYRWPALAWLEPYARVGGGVVVGDLAIDPQAGGPGSVDQAVAPIVAAAVGVEFLVPRTVFWKPDSTSAFRHFTFGLAVEAGWSHAFGMAFALDTGRDPGPGLSGGGVALGEIVLSGLASRVAVTLHF